MIMASRWRYVGSAGRAICACITRETIADYRGRDDGWLPGLVSGGGVVARVFVAILGLSGVRLAVPRQLWPSYHDLIWREIYGG